MVINGMIATFDGNLYVIVTCTILTGADNVYRCRIDETPPGPTVQGPKVWAKELREFLEGLLGRWRELPIFLPQMRAQNRKKAVARASPLRFAEWKMKRWKQSLATS
jgi:hypothetical protein